MMLILKIPIVYLCLVVYWAVRAEPKPPEPAQLPAEPFELEPRPPWSPRAAPAEAGAPRLAREGPPGSGAPVSAQPESRQRPADVVAGLLASLAIFASLVGIAYRPFRLIPAALLLALLAARARAGTCGWRRLRSASAAPAS